MPLLLGRALSGSCWLVKSLNKISLISAKIIRGACFCCFTFKWAPMPFIFFLVLAR